MKLIDEEKIRKDNRRFLKHFPRIEDNSTLVILKGHLLIEELLNELIERRLDRPEELRDVDLTFNQRLFMAKALYSMATKGEWFWEAIKKLNNLRNQLAHHLEPKGFHDKLEDFLKYVEIKRDIMPEEFYKKESRLYIAIFSIHFRLSFLLSQKPLLGGQ